MLFKKRKTEEFHFTPEQEACLANCRQLSNDELRILNGGGSYKGMPSSVQMQQGLSGGSSDDNSNSSSGKSEGKGHHGMPSDVEAMLEHSGSSSVTEKSSNAGQTTVTTVAYPAQPATQPSAPKPTESEPAVNHGTGSASGSGSTNNSSASASSSSTNNSSPSASTSSGSLGNGRNQSGASGSENTSSALSDTAITFPTVLPDPIEIDKGEQQVSSENISKNLQNMSINLFGLIEFTLKDGCDFMTELVGSELSNYATVNNGLYRSIPLGDDISLYMQSGNFVTSYPSVSITSEECWKLKAWTEYDGQLLLDSTIGNFDPSRIKGHLDFTFRP